GLAGGRELPAVLNRFPLQGLIKGSKPHQDVHRPADRTQIAENGSHQIRPTGYTDYSPIEAADDEKHGSQHVHLFHGSSLQRRCSVCLTSVEETKVPTACCQAWVERNRLTRARRGCTISRDRARTFHCAPLPRSSGRA